MKNQRNEVQESLQKLSKSTQSHPGTPEIRSKGHIEKSHQPHDSERIYKTKIAIIIRLFNHAICL